MNLLPDRASRGCLRKERGHIRSRSPWKDRQEKPMRDKADARTKIHPHYIVNMPQCSAITNALAATGYTNAQLANKTGLGTQRVDDILAGSVRPTQDEFKSIAKALNLNSNTPHAAQVAV
jgi:ribosome-binding protein aMBF1 (putative translation factor)